MHVRFTRYLLIVGEGSFSSTPLISQPLTLYFISYSWLYVSEIIDTGKKIRNIWYCLNNHISFNRLHVHNVKLFEQNTPKSLIEYGFRGKAIKKIIQMSLRATCNTNVSTSNSSRNASLESHFFLRIVLAPVLYMCDVSCLNSSPNLRNLRNLSNYWLKTPVLDRFLIETWGLIGSKRICIAYLRARLCKLALNMYMKWVCPY